MKIAFYKGKGNFFNWLIRKWDGGKYSHCELVFSNGFSASASYRDGRQVRAKVIEFNPEHWDFINVPTELEGGALTFLEETNGKPYDLVGQIRFIVAPLTGSKEGYWCSEWVAAALGMPEAWRYSPNSLYAALKYMNNT